MRAFVAVETGEDVRQKIAALEQGLPAGIRQVEAANLHMTLAFLGEIDETKAELVKDALEGISAVPFEVKCRGVGVFPSMSFVRVVWVGALSEGLRHLHAQIGSALEPLGFKKEEFSPHITIGIPKSRVDLHPFVRAHEDDDFGSFVVDRLILKKSTLTPAGPVYENVHVKRLG
ncbi:RNA 2',3'-cyclic phosphodiesterase [Candidatus Burarchaeum australiense]|nr:RNA 2',3'-cyclic phosphodiesterase [Candidatus Burarchaeum australiense]